jgi:ribosomal protein S18 acetylase RimI-like enzyme
MKEFAIDTSGLCMAMDLSALQVLRPKEDNMRAMLVEEADALGEWVKIVNVALAGRKLMSFAQFEDIYCLENTRFFLGCLGDTPAAASMTLRDSEMATLEMVATLNEFRYRGLGTAVTLAALQDLQSFGVKTVTLRAEPDGINLYKRVGFQEICNRVVASYPS